MEPYRQIELDSAYAQHQREEMAYRRKWQAEEEEKRRVLRKSLERVGRVLDDPQNSHVAAWDAAFWAASQEVDGRGLELIPPGDLVARPFWQQASAQRRRRILEAAQGYLQTEDPRAWDWITTNQIPELAMLGTQALFLLAGQAPEQLEALSADDWARWIPVLLRALPGEKAVETLTQLLSSAYRAAPQALISDLVRLIEHHDHADPVLFALREVEPLLHDAQARDAIGEALLDQLERAPLRARSVLQVLGCLMKHGHAPAGERARRWVADESGERQIMGAATLLLFAQDAGWDRVWPLLRDHLPQAKTVVEMMADYKATTAEVQFPGPYLDDEPLVDLYLWLSRHFPGPGKQKRSRGTQPVTEEMRIERWRDGLLGLLKSRGTRSSMAALHRIAEELDHPQWLIWTLREADEILRWRTWVHWEPEELLELIERESRPIIRTDEELQDAILASLARYEEILQGGITPRAVRLWNLHPNYPRQEGFVTDEIVHHLREEFQLWGVTISPEEETRRPTGRETGKRPDITMRRVVPRDGRTQTEVRCAVEVKRCCHEQVKESMEAQLVRRYMARQAFRSGIYLVVWFNRESWAADRDARSRKRIPFDTLDEARAWFDKRAQELSAPGLRVKAYVLDASLPRPRPPSHQGHPAAGK